MPELQGSSPQQVAWATEIRTNMIQAMLLLQKQYAVHKPDRADVVALGLERLINRENQASWWIDRRLHKPRAWEATVERLVTEGEANKIYRKHEKLAKHREVSIF